MFFILRYEVPEPGTFELSMLVSHPPRRSANTAGGGEHDWLFCTFIIVVGVLHVQAGQQKHDLSRAT